MAKKSTLVPIIGTILTVLAGGCATTLLQVSSQTGAPPLCAAGADLGAVAVTLSTKWRPDQKEALERESLARQSITKTFSNLRCGRFVGFEAAGADTSVGLVLREFGPQLVISIPVLWTLHADVAFDVTVIDRRSGTVLLDRSEHRTYGGPFVVQRMDAVQRTFEAALTNVLYGE